MAEKKTILLAIDGSGTAEHAFDWYTENLHQPGNELVILHTLLPEIHVHPFMGARQEMMLEKFKKQQEEEKVIRAAYETKLTNSSIPGRYTSKQGKAGETITMAAKEEGAKFIVIGSRGHGAIGRAFLGSVSTYVLHHAHCPVVIVRKDKQ